MKTVVITGSGTGMGPAIVERLVRGGYQAIGVDLPGKGAEISGDLPSPQAVEYLPGPPSQ